MKPVKQNVIANYKGEEIKVQFNFCPECKYYEGCYNDYRYPSYISPECYNIGMELGYDV